MPCRDWVGEDGRITGIVCGPRAPRKRCPWCRVRWAERECDGPWRKSTGRTGTCDAAICAACATPFGAGLDLCPPHGALEAEMQAGREVSDVRG